MTIQQGPAVLASRPREKVKTVDVRGVASRMWLSDFSGAAIMALPDSAGLVDLPTTIFVHYGCANETAKSAEVLIRVARSLRVGP